MNLGKSAIQESLDKVVLSCAWTYAGSATNTTESAITDVTTIKLSAVCATYDVEDYYEDPQVSHRGG